MNVGRQSVTRTSMLPITLHKCKHEIIGENTIISYLHWILNTNSKCIAFEVVKEMDKWGDYCISKEDGLKSFSEAKFFFLNILYFGTMIFNMHFWFPTKQQNKNHSFYSSLFLLPVCANLFLIMITNNNKNNQNSPSFPNGEKLMHLI